MYCPLGQTFVRPTTWQLLDHPPLVEYTWDPFAVLQGAHTPLLVPVHPLFHCPTWQSVSIQLAVGQLELGAELLI